MPKQDYDYLTRYFAYVGGDAFYMAKIQVVRAKDIHPFLPGITPSWLIIVDESDIKYYWDRVFPFQQVGSLFNNLSHGEIFEIESNALDYIKKEIENRVAWAIAEHTKVLRMQQALWEVFRENKRKEKEAKDD